MTYKGSSNPTSLVIKEGTVSIADYALAGCTNLTNIEIPASLTTFGGHAFDDTQWLKNKQLPLYINDILVKADNTTPNFVVQSGTKGIGGGAFYECNNLLSVSIPETVKTIGIGAFANCKNLVDITIPSSVVKIGDCPIENCEKLEAIQVDPNNTMYKSVDGLLYNHNCDSLIQYPAGKGNANFARNMRYICYYAIGSNNSNYNTLAYQKNLSWVDLGNVQYGSKLKYVYLPCRTNSVDGRRVYHTSGTEVYNYSTCDVSVPNNVSVVNKLNAEVYLSGKPQKNNFTNALAILRNAYLPNTIVKITDSYYNIIDYLPDSYFFKINTIWTAINYRMLDGEPFYCPEQMVASKITYTREFNNDDWQAWFLPYSLAYDEWKDLGEVAELANVGLDGSNEPVLIWHRITDGELLPNHPYIFKPNAMGKMIFNGENKTIMPTDNTDVVSYTADGIVYSLSGIYQEKTNMATTHAYALSSGDFRPTNSNSKTLKPFRIYLTINSGSQKAPQRVRNIIADDNDLSGIKIITATNDTESSYYDLMGRKVDNPLNGIYIQNNKKVIIK